MQPGHNNMTIISDAGDENAGRRAADRVLLAVGGFILRYGLVFFLVVFGLAKWTKAEALGIQPLAGHSPLLGWLYHVTDVQRASEVIGMVELVIGGLIASRPLLPLASAAGSLLGAGMFVTTLSFLATTPGLNPNSADGGFLLKDLILLGAALWSAGESLQAVRIRSIRNVSALPGGKAGLI